ncbi:hypothetical protein [Streptomyces sp. T028]|uniref:hypothetical protein n=1 Tax=Streptomyces sp. T028 TaxID=3394379 RepID=UPI003A836D84
MAYRTAVLPRGCRPYDAAVPRTGHVPGHPRRLEPREAVARKVDQLREAQRAGRLDPVWDPVDVLALVNQIATTWATQTEIGSVGPPNRPRTRPSPPAAPPWSPRSNASSRVLRGRRTM